MRGIRGYGGFEGCALRGLSGFVIRHNGNDYISLLVPYVNIPVRLGNLFKRICSVYGRFQLPRLDKLFEKNKVFSVFLLCHLVD